MVPGRSQTIFLLVSDQRIGDGLERACRAQGFSPIVGATVSDIGSRLGGSPPAPVILHTAALPTDKDLAEVLDYFAWVAERRIPTLVLATEDDLQMRLAARRAGCIGFHLLPISDSDLAEILAPFSGDDRLSQERVLVVDDVKVEAMISGQILRKAGYDVLELCNELEIIDRIRSFHPDLILMDLNMPNASGSELTAIIRDHADMLLTPIVFLSGEQDAAAQREAMRLGADEFLSKPVSPQNLVATVIHREWVLWMRDRLLERQLLGYAPLVVLRAEDLLAHLGVASALFRLLEQLQVEVCLERLNTEPATLSLLTSFPLAYAAVDPALLQAKESRTPLIKLVDAAHAQHVPLIASDIDDEETLARVRQCGVDLVAGTFIQAPSISMDFAFEPCGEGA